jgi:hypothetical protein
MVIQELNFNDLARGLQATPEPSADMWSRIAGAHVARRQRRVRVRLAATFAFTLAGAAFFLVAPHLVPGTDWQARAQALELELRALPASDDAAEGTVAREAESGLGRIDRALQAAYDRGARANELVPLWKQRSELLSTLMAVRQQSASVIRI